MVATEIFLIAAGVICVVVSVVMSLEMIKRMWRAVLNRN